MLSEQVLEQNKAPMVLRWDYVLSRKEVSAKIAQLEADNVRLREALEGAMKNTILLIEYAEPVYREHAKYGLTAMARVLDETGGDDAP